MRGVTWSGSFRNLEGGTGGNSPAHVDNLGRIAGEYPHLPSFRFGPGERVEVEGIEHIEALRDDGKPGLFFGGHFGNLELPGICVARQGLPLHLIYRAASNPHVNWIYERSRANTGVELIPKGADWGADGARQAQTQ